MNKRIIVSDLLAGLSVSFAALALGAAFGIMSGRGAFAGMIAAGVIPIITGLFGGTRLSVSGPTAPMTAVSALVIAFAYDNFKGDKILAEQFITLVFLLTGFFLAIAGILRAGKLIRLVPQVVILGFMSGIALLIWIDQIKTLFGMDGKIAPAGDLWLNIVLALSTLFLILGLPYFLHKIKVPKSLMLFIPHTLTGIILMTVVTYVLQLDVGKVTLGTSMNSFSEFLGLISGYFPSREIFSMEYVLLALPYSAQLVMLCYLDSLLTALIMDFLTKEESNLNKELVGQGLANGLSAIFMGIPGAQATIRSVLLFKEGASTRLGAVSVGIFSLFGLLFFKDYVSLISSAVFIGVLFKAALDVFEKEFIRVYFKRKWHRIKSRNIQLAFIVYTMLVTAFIDLNVAVISGTLLFYLGKKFFNLADAEQDLGVEEPTEIWLEELQEQSENIKKINFMKTLTKEVQEKLTPRMAIQILKNGNERFVNNLRINRNYLEQVNETSGGQHPFAVILSCIDSRTPAVLIFDQGLGDVFVIRIAGNISNDDVLGSMEFACKVAGAKLIMVLGHTKCGAVIGACNDVKMGNLTTLLEKIKPAVIAENTVTSNRNAGNEEFVEKVASLNVKLTMQQILKKSQILKNMVEQGEIAIVGGMYDIRTGKVDFYENTNKPLSRETLFAHNAA